jgi:hypothetical protein
MEARKALGRGDASTAVGLLAASTDLASGLTRASALWDLGRLEEMWALCWDLFERHPNCVRLLYLLRSCGGATGKVLHVRTVTRHLGDIDPDFCIYGRRFGAVSAPA